MSSWKIMSIIGVMSGPALPSVMFLPYSKSIMRSR